MSLLSILAACALAFGLPAPALQGRMPGQQREKPEPAVRPTPTPGGQKEIDRQHAEMQGIWKMIEFRSPDMPPHSRLENAYCLVHEEFLSMEVHMDLLGERKQVAFRIFDSGFYRFEIFEGSRLEMKSMISCFADVAGRTQFRPPGFTRRYRIEILEDRMTWVRDDGQRSVFQRFAGTSTKRDIFGRKTEPKDRADEKPPTGSKRE